MRASYLLLILLLSISWLSPLVVGAQEETASSAVDATRPSVVTVYTYRPGGTFAPGGSGRAPSGSGSGWAYGDTGYIVTNAHVVYDAREVTVVTVAGKQIPATIIGSDWYQDVAVLQLDDGRESDFPPPAPIGTSAEAELTDPVVAIGTPHGQFADTVSEGAIIGINQRINTGNGYSILNLIQHSATLAPGNSGGPLVDADGEVIGMNVASRTITNPDEDTVIGFAIAIDAAVPLVEEIIESGSVRRPWLGVNTTLDEGQTIVASIEDDAAEGAAQLESGDRILAIDDDDVSRSVPFIDLLYRHEPGDAIVLSIDRDGQKIEVELSLGARERGD